MRRTEVTYRQLDMVLRSLGFSCWEANQDSPARVYEHQSGALVTTPPFPLDNFVYEHHLLIARMAVDQFGIADPKVFDAKLRKAG